MSKRCPDCGQINEDSRIFCSACGEALNADIRLIQGLEKQSTAAPKAQPVSRQDDDDDDYVPPKSTQKKTSGAVPWIVLALIAAAAVIAWFALK